MGQFCYAIAMAIRKQRFRQRSANIWWRQRPSQWRHKCLKVSPRSLKTGKQKKSLVVSPLFS